MNARILDEAKVCGRAIVYRNATVSVMAKVYDEATVGGEAYIFENAEIGRTANIGSVTQIGGDTVIRYTTDYLTIQGITKDSITFHKSNDKIMICNEHYFGSLDNFRKQAFEIPQDNIVKELLLLIELAEYHFENQN